MKKHFNAKTGKTGWRANLYRWRTIPAHAEVHESVYERKGPSLSRLPIDAVLVATAKGVGEGRLDSVPPTISLVAAGGAGEIAP